MKYTRNFNELTKNDTHVAGGKGASLGEMLQHHIPVPDGYVVTADTFDYFIKETDLIQEIDAILDTVDTKTIHTVEHASGKIQALIKHADMPKDIADEVLIQYKNHNMEYVAVRSSATAEDGADHAWAGQLSSYLNTTDENILEMVQSCWASLFTPRAIFYRFEKGLHTTHISVAVVVQKMVNSELSGIAFSVHPVTEDYNQIIIEAGLGLGEAIVSGSVTPDSYVVTKEPQEIIDVNVNAQNKALYRSDTLDTEHGFNEWKNLSESEANTQVLSKDKIIELSNIIQNIEDHYGFPCDIEWAFENDIFYIVQSRPITTLKPISKEPKISFEKAYTRDTSMIIQQGWNACVSSPYYSSETNPHTPPVIHYMNDGVIEIWENEKATQWILDSLQEFIKTDETKLVSFIDQYEKDLKDMKLIWENGVIKKASELESFVEKVFIVMKGFDTMYFPSVDERTPEHIRERTLKLRDEDVYFDTCDKLIRDSLVVIYPQLKGYESAILKSEINNPPLKEVLSKRKEGFVVIGQEFAEQTSLREYLSQHPEYKFHIETPPADSSTLIGQVGNKGYAKGTVRIMKRKDQIDQAQDGDIIVSTMTTPDFIPAMKKAVAIITDEGGVTCHAAIVAREMNKPCVIGTKFATQILKDGDMVEVDADNGIVKIIEKTNLVEFQSPELKDINPDNFTFYGLWKNDILSSAFWQNCLNKDLIKEIGLNIDDLGNSSLQGGNFLVKNEIEYGIRDQVKEKIVNNDKKFFDNLKKITDRVCNESIEFGKTIKGMEVTKNNTELIFEELKKINLLWYLGASHLVNGSEELLSEKIVEEKFPADKAFDIIPQVITPIHEQQQDVKRLKKLVGNKTLVEIKEDESLLKELQDHVDEYYWIEILNFIGEILTVDRLYEQIKSFKDGEDNADQNKLPEISEELEFRAYCMHISGYVKQLTAEYFSMLSGRALEYFKQIAEKLDLEYREFTMLTPTEILKGLSGEISKEELKTRGIRRRDLQWFLMSNGDLDPILIENKHDVEILVDKMLPKNESGSNTITGVSAYKGKVKGKVVVIMSTDEFHKMKPDDILVTTMTTPDFVILMQQAKAIVTDIGGLLCHAAIVSREIKTPCIIGTKFGTQILNDGDLVEVDADTGIVKILEKNELVEWEKVLQRNFPPLAWTGGGYYELRGIQIGPMNWIREREMQVKYKVAQSYMVQDPTAYYTSNIVDLIQEVNSEFDIGIDENNQKIMEMVEVQAGNNLDDLKILNDQHRLSYALMLIGFDVAINIKEKIDAVIKNKPENLEAYLGTPWKPTAIQREQITLEEIRKEIGENPENKDELLKKMTLDFGYIHQDYLGQPWEKADYEKALSDGITLHSGMIDDYDDSKLSDYEKWLISIFKKFTYMYEEGRNAMVRCAWAMKATVQSLGHNPDDLLYMTDGEVNDFSQSNGEFITQELVALRKKAFAFHFDNGIYTEFSGEAEVEKLIQKQSIGKFWEVQNYDVKELSGSVAYKGYAKGKARIVLTQEDSNQIKEGEILISPMTQVEFLSGIRKCAAIVTDEGGIICHAAIVSREFGKPCILGTGKATQAIKTGDMVEVDAEKGIVRIIKD
jgi:phosphoenolpyruvate synthase/pyruvate phosphate dikinase